MFEQIRLNKKFISIVSYSNPRIQVRHEQYFFDANKKIVLFVHQNRSLSLNMNIKQFTIFGYIYRVIISVLGNINDSMSFSLIGLFH